MKRLHRFVGVVMAILAWLSVALPVGAQTRAASLTVEPAKTSLQGKYLTVAKSNKDVQALMKFLFEKGLVAANESVNVLSSDKEAVWVVLLDFSMPDRPDSRVAHIAFWQGMLGHKRSQGVVAGFEGEDVVWVAKGEKLQQLPMKAWEEGLSIPLNSIQAPVTPQDVQGTVEKTSMGNTPSSTSVQSIGCKEVDAYRQLRSLLGFLLFRFHQVKEWCYDGWTVSGVSVSTYVSHVADTYHYRGIVEKWDRPRDGYHDSMRQAHMENCIVKYGCIANVYPAVRIIARADGTWTYSTWS